MLIISMPFFSDNFRKLKIFVKLYKARKAIGSTVALTKNLSMNSLCKQRGPNLLLYVDYHPTLYSTSILHFDDPFIIVATIPNLLD